MYFVLFCIATFFISPWFAVEADTTATRDWDLVCYKAKICLHNAQEKCGLNGKGTPRRFYDTCDIKEYNCENHEDYVKALPKYCKDLPDIQPRKTHST